LFWDLLVLVFLGVWDEALSHDLRSFCPFNICIHGCKLSSQNCLCCVPEVPVGCFFIFINFQESFNFLFYFINDPLVIKQCVVQFPATCMFFIIIFVVEF
jgi:hypothetical protein